MSYQSPIPLMIEELKTIPELKKVSGMITLEAMLQQSLPSPSCFVYHTNDELITSSLKNETLNTKEVVAQQLDKFTQVFNSFFCVSVVYKNFTIKNETNEDVSTDINQLVIEKLNGWKPFAEYPLIYQSSSPLFEQNRLIRENVFSFIRVISGGYR